MLTNPGKEYEEILEDVHENFINSEKITIEEWLKLINNPPKDKRFISYTFPTEAHKTEYLATIDKRSMAEIKRLIYNFLPPRYPLGQDLRMKVGNEQARLIEKLKAEGELRYTDQQWLLWALTESERFSPRESIHWVLDLVDRFPEEAIQVINAYILLSVQALPDLRLNGLFECVEIIRAKCHVSSIPDEVIESLSSRDFEYLVESLYKSMGYVTILTPPTKDGGYDVIASKLDKGLKTSILIDAKHYKKPVGVEIVRQIQGVVAKEGASKGVIVTTSKFTRGALNRERDDPRLELITRQEFIQLMNQYTGVDWTSRIDRIIFRSKQTHIEQQDSYVPQ